MKSKDNILFKKKLSESRGVNVSTHSEERIFPRNDESSELSVACYRADFSASRISRAVEDADAHLLNLNVTSEILPSGEIVVDLRVSHRDAGAVSRSLERYGYSTLNIRSGRDLLSESVAERIDQLMAHIDI